MSKSISSIKTPDTREITLDNPPIYKVKHLVNGLIHSIYIFYGKKPIENEDEIFNKIFTDEENEQIKSQRISIKFSEQQIHFDDSIGTIKIKILNELKNNNSLDELYLYCQKNEKLNTVSLYQSLTQNNKLPLTKVRLEQFISNIISDENGNKIKIPEDKEIYSFDDIFQMNLDNKKYIVNKVLGQKFFIVENEYPFVCNPYDVEGYDKFFEKTARKSLTTLNSHLLLNSGEIIDNSIYLCLTEDVVTYLSRKDISEEATIKIYYPFLYNKNINNIEDLNTDRSKLIENNKKIINSKTFETFDNIDMFYDVFSLRKNELNYVNKGIKYIKAIMRPEFEIKIPLEIIFKIIHATQDNPLIKYNPSSRQENVYRIFTDKNSTDGRKIPYLKKSVIFKLMKNIARTKSVSIYIETKFNENVQIIICEFDEEGFITIITEFKNVVNINEINNLFKQTVNPIIQEIKSFLEQSGYKLNIFNSLSDDNIEIKQLTYETQIMIKKPLNIDTYKGCISSIFINETNTLKGNLLNLRFKRVSNYSKFNSQEAFILEKSEQGLRGDQIIEALLENFSDDLNRQQAVEMVRKIANELEIERGARKSDIKIKENPGFKTTILLEKESGIITITTENINNINYLYTLPIYFDTIVRLTQDKKSTNYPIKSINKLCLSGEKKDIFIKDIISSTEESASNSETPYLDQDDEEVQYTKFKKLEIDKPKGALSLFFDDEDDDNDDVDDDDEDAEGYKQTTFEGGKPESESSIPSDDSLSEKSVSSDKSELSEKSVSSDNSLSDIVVDKSESSDNSLSDNSLSDIVVDKSESSDKPKSSDKTLSDIVVDNFESTDKPKSSDIVFEKSINNIQIPSIKDSTLDQQLVSSSDKKNKEGNDNDNDNEDNDNEDNDNEDNDDNDNEDNENNEDNDNDNDDNDNEDNEDNEDNDNEDEEEENDNEIRNIDGMKLNKPYYFQNLIEKKDPILILKEDTPQYNSYVRTCSSSMRKQPVILTDTQLEKINKEHPGFLRDEDVIKYGSNPKKQFNYICPRYWCLKNNTLIDPKDLKEVINKDGKKELEHPTCGKVLQKGDKKVKPGYYIYEFYNTKPGKKDYKKYPGLIPESHPDGYCLPCCFDKYNTVGRIKANKKCYGKEGKQNDVKNVKDNEKEIKGEDEDIMGPEKFPLDKGRWGYLPNELQIMLKEFNVDCQISKTNTKIKNNHPCLLRHGIEISTNQSFISCISDEIFFLKKYDNQNNKDVKKQTKILDVKEMRERIIKSISIDTFINYQNGNLVLDFYNLDKNVDIKKYTNTKLFKKLNMDNPEEKTYYMKVISAYENFILFLKDDEALIDHTYLWDIISMPNKYLFPNGVNLIIFNLPKDDITNNVQLLCPTNHYSNEYYQSRKPTIIILKEDKYYEPIYLYTNNEKISVDKEFKEQDPTLSKTIRTLFNKIIKPFFNTICRPLDSMPNVYKAKKAIFLYDLVDKLEKYKYKITKLVVNFNNKVIGVLAQEPKTIEEEETNLNSISCFIPCYPSSVNEKFKDIDLVFMNNFKIWNTYKNTIEFLNNLYKRSKKRVGEAATIPCKPAFKVIEDEHVVGILTVSNQFIQISKPIRVDEVHPNLDIPSLTNDNYIIDINSQPMVQSDIEITTRTDVDKERVDYIKKIRLETNFYNVFRNTIRILLNNYDNIKNREKIESEMMKEYIIYSEKQKNINKLLRNLVENKIQFNGDENYYKLINEVSTCLVKDKTNCSNTPNLCVITGNDDCNLILPEKNLLTGKLNEPIYYGRMADELIRYNRIKSFMLQPTTYLSFGNVNYNLKDNEIILIQSLLTQEYFENLVPTVTNKYSRYNSYDEAEPAITQVYDNLVKLSELDELNRINQLNVVDQIEENCEKIVKKKITSSAWKICFPKNYSEIEYKNLSVCTFNIIIDLIENKTGNKLTLNQIKNELYEEYKKYLTIYFYKIIRILIIEGKQFLDDDPDHAELSFSNLIYSANYFLTTLDLWLLVTKYEIPTIFISQKPILQSKKNEFIGYGDKEDEFVFIVIPSFSSKNIPSYKLIQSNENDFLISLDKLNSQCVDRINDSIKEKNTIEEYLSNFVPPKKNVKKKDFIVESDSEEENRFINKKKNKRTMIVEKSSSITPDKFITQAKSKKNKKGKQIQLRNNNTKKNKKKSFIIESSSK